MEFEEFGHELLVQDPIMVLGKRCGMPDGIARVEVQEQAEQQVVVEFLHQQLIRANTVNRLQQLFRWDRGPTTIGLKPTEVVVKPI